MEAEPNGNELIGKHAGSREDDNHRFGNSDCEGRALRQRSSCWLHGCSPTGKRISIAAACSHRGYPLRIWGSGPVTCMRSRKTVVENRQLCPRPEMRGMKVAIVTLLEHTIDAPYRISPLELHVMDISAASQRQTHKVIFVRRPRRMPDWLGQP